MPGSQGRLWGENAGIRVILASDWSTLTILNCDWLTGSPGPRCSTVTSFLWTMTCASPPRASGQSGFWLVKTNHVTWSRASDWSCKITGLTSDWSIMVSDWLSGLNTDLWLVDRAGAGESRGSGEAEMETEMQLGSSGKGESWNLYSSIKNNQKELCCVQLLEKYYPLLIHFSRLSQTALWAQTH